MMSALPGLGKQHGYVWHDNPDMSLPPFVMPPQTNYATHPMPVSPYPSPHSMFDVSPLSHPPPSVSPVNNTTNNTPRMMSPMVEPTDQLVAYYFEHVRKLQFAFAGQELTQVLYLVLQRDPHGPLKHAICALASLHSTKLQMHGFDEETSGARAMHKRYFDQGHCVLLQRQDDALGAVFLIGYYMMVGGGRNWLKLLDIACDWFATQSGLDAQRLAVKTVMWIDIQSSIIFTSTPRFLAVYRRLLGSGGGGFWGTTTPSSTLTGTDRTTDLRMDKLTGCPDEAVLALAESAHLASWKQHHQAHGTLSVRELVGRADQIEQTLRQTQAVRSVSSSPVNEVGPSGGLLPSGLPAAASDMFGGAGAEMDEAARRAIPQVWRETAILYLHTVLSDALPGVLEIQKSVSTLGDWFNGFTASPLDRSVLLPLILTATLTDNVIMHDIVKGRIALHGGDMMFNGAMAQAARFVEYVWQRRRARPAGVPVDWRECMQERWSSLVMV
ncbi:fungal-specific transcription factor domain-containing protein [Irpex lacteus]|nr:fungal-specific transcription factor domain-containing protein [Irpex lacteus]